MCASNLWLSSVLSAGGLRLWSAEKGLVPLLERGRALPEQLLLGGRAGQGVRGVLRDQVHGCRRPICGAWDLHSPDVKIPMFAVFLKAEARTDA